MTNRPAEGREEKCTCVKKHSDKCLVYKARVERFVRACMTVDPEPILYVSPRMLTDIEKMMKKP